MSITQQHNLVWGGKILSNKVRSSNLELYRIICMFMILTHHFVYSSPLSGCISSDSTSLNALFLGVIGLWGKTGINCFMMITGYFMCKSTITLRKFLKLILEVYFYRLVIYAILFVFGYETASPMRLIQLIMPVWGFEVNFVSCFIGFWLTIPFLNILIKNMNQFQHKMLIVLLLTMYTLLGSIPGFKVAMNYVSWFAVIYFVASYIRLYPSSLFQRKSLWGFATLCSFILACLCILLLQYNAGLGPFLVSDSNKILAVVVAVCSFLYFKNLEIPYSKTINVIGASTFGILLIHTNSSAMRQFLWIDICHCDTLFALPTFDLVCRVLFLILSVYIICSIIDIIRIKTVEIPLLNITERGCLSIYNKIKKK